MQCIVGVVYMWSHWNILRNSRLSELSRVLQRCCRHTDHRTLFTAMLDADTDDLDRYD